MIVKLLKDEISAGILRFPVVTFCNLNEFRFSQITRNDMYHAGEFLGFLTDERKLHPATIPKEDIANPEEYEAMLNRLEGPVLKFIHETIILIITEVKEVVRIRF